MTDLAHLNASRKAERRQIAEALKAVAASYGATVEEREGMRGRSIDLRFTLNGVGASIGVNNIHGGHEALISWHNDYSHDKRATQDFDFGFNIAVGSRNSWGGGRLHHKATSYGDWDDVAHYLGEGLALAAECEAFAEETGRRLTTPF